MSDPYTRPELPHDGSMPEDSWPTYSPNPQPSSSSNLPSPYTAPGVPQQPYGQPMTGQPGQGPVNQTNNYYAMMPFTVSPVPAPNNGLGNAALPLGAVALFFGFIPFVGSPVAIPTGILAIIFGALGLVRANRGEATNKTQALIGLVLGIASFIIMLGYGYDLLWFF